MLDIQFIRDNAELVQEKTRQKGKNTDIAKLLKVDEERRELLQKVEGIRAERNELTAASKGQKPSEEQIKKGKQLRAEIEKIGAQLQKVEESYQLLLEKVPNIFPDDTPIGGEEANKPVRHHGKAEKKEIKDHLTWAEEKGLVDFERGAKVAGAKFYFTKGSLVELEYACIQLAMNLAVKHGFTPITVPHLINTRTSAGAGFSPRGEEDQIYMIEGEDLLLIATAETPITGFHADEVLKASELPLLYVGISPAYRKEAGAYGKHSRGLFRVHQFNKVELYVFCEPAESEKWHQKLVEIEEELCQLLEIPYQLVRIASGDLGGSAYKKFDIEYWSPAEGEYRELMSSSIVTDYQARRLNIRYSDENGVKNYVHTLNATAMAFSRAAIAMIENHQDENGDVVIPKALQSYMGGKKTI